MNEEKLNWPNCNGSTRIGRDETLYRTIQSFVMRGPDSRLFAQFGQGSLSFLKTLLEAHRLVPHILLCQGPWNVDLRTPPGPEGSNGSLLDICRGHPGIFYFSRFAAD